MDVLCMTCCVPAYALLLVMAVVTLVPMYWVYDHMLLSCIIAVVLLVSYMYYPRAVSKTPKIEKQPSPGSPYLDMDGLSECAINMYMEEIDHIGVDDPPHYKLEGYELGGWR